MKFTLAQQKEQLGYLETHLAGHETALRNMQVKVERERERLEFFRSQIAEAERRGMDGFDAARFMQTKRS